MLTIAQRLVAARKKAGKTQKEVAEQLGTTYQAYAQYERGIRNPKYSTLEKLANALNCDISELVDSKEEAELIIASLLDRLKGGRVQSDPESSIDEDDFVDAFDEHEQPGIIVQRYTKFVTTHSYMMQIIQKIGIELRIIDWRQISISYNDVETEARISELQSGLESLESRFEDSVKSMFHDYYGFNFPETKDSDNDEEED